MFDSSDRLSDRSDKAFTRYDRRTDQSDRPVGPIGSVNTQLLEMRGTGPEILLRTFGGTVEHPVVATKSARNSQTPNGRQTSRNGGGFRQCEVLCYITVFIHQHKR